MIEIATDTATNTATDTATDTATVTAAPHRAGHWQKGTSVSATEDAGPGLAIGLALSGCLLVAMLRGRVCVAPQAPDADANGLIHQGSAASGGDSGRA